MQLGYNFAGISGLSRGLLGNASKSSDEGKKKFSVPCEGALERRLQRRTRRSDDTLYPADRTFPGRML